jgi:exosortase family protein XrtF
MLYFCEIRYYFLKRLLLKYRAVIRFVLLFLGTYLVLSFLYSFYLNVSAGTSYHPDFITHLVAKQSTSIISSLGYDAEIVPHETEALMELYINKRYLGRIIEGCNAVSIIILFIAFIVAFAKNFKKTILFILAGSVLIYGANIIRIAVLSIALHLYPQYEKILHGVVFPALIYGMVFLLWMLWVRGLTHKTDKEDA